MRIGPSFLIVMAGLLACGHAEPTVAARPLDCSGVDQTIFAELQRLTADPGQLIELRQQTPDTATVAELQRVLADTARVNALRRQAADPARVAALMPQLEALQADGERFRKCRGS